MGLAAGCGVANNEAGNDRDRNNLTPVGYDNNTRYSPLNVADPTDPAETPGTDNNAVTDDGTNAGTNDVTDDGTDDGGEYSPDPALNQDEANDGDGDETDADNADNSDNNDAADNGTDTDTDTDANPEVDNTPGTETETGEKTETKTPALGGNATKFADVPDNNPYVNDIHAARDLGLLNGVGNNKFGLGSNLTREQMASILMKAYRAGYISGITNNDNTENNTGTNNETGTNNNTGTDNTDTNNTDTETNNNTTDTTGAGQ